MKIDKVPLTAWSEVLHTYSRFAEFSETSDHWVFRGCANSKWHLKSSLERACDQLCIPANDRERREGGLLRRFKRQYQNYGLESPRDGDTPEWLSLMQHYGAPTRLLDFTHSFFVALFFALEDLPDGSRTPILWAVNQTKLDSTFKKKHRSVAALFGKGRNSWTHESFKRVFRRNPRIRFVRSLNPYQLNQRLIVQQGLFLCPGDIRCSFNQNLESIFGAAPSRDQCLAFVLDFGLEEWKTALRQLEKMNMTASTLFPGLDGFSRSLRTHMVFKTEILPPDPELTEVATTFEQLF